MMIEAIRAHLVAKGITAASEWTHEQVMQCVDTELLECSTEDTEAFEDAITNLWDGIKVNLLTVNDVLSEGMQSEA